MTEEHEKRYYQLVFIKLNDPATFAEYGRKVAPVAARYGALERALAPDTLYAEGLWKPDLINLVYYNDKEAFRGLSADPEFLKVIALRQRSIEMMSVFGFSARGDVSSTALSERLYLVEVARFGDKGEAGYREYESSAEKVMSQYGYHVERVVEPDTNQGFPFDPDIVKIAYFDEASGLERMHRDPNHERIEKELYPAATAESIWMTARVRAPR